MNGLNLHLDPVIPIDIANVVLNVITGSLYYSLIKCLLDPGFLASIHSSFVVDLAKLAVRCIGGRSGSLRCFLFGLQIYRRPWSQRRAG